jgi:hypothetical protein
VSVAGENREKWEKMRKIRGAGLDDLTVQRSHTNFSSLKNHRERVVRIILSVKKLPTKECRGPSERIGGWEIGKLCVRN